MSNLFKVATSTIIRLAMDLDMSKQEKCRGHKKLGLNY